MQLRIDATEVVRHGRQLNGLPNFLRGRLWTSLRVTSMELVRAIKGDMPVDSGRARSSWGQWSPEDIAKPNDEAKPSDAHYEEDKGDLSIEQGSNVPYISKLNDGHSQQAPAGFIDRNVDTAKRVMNERAARITMETRP